MKDKLNLKNKIINILKKGGVVILPTDTVYGLFCCAFNKTVVKKIYKIKGRDFTKPLQVFFSNMKEILKYCQINKKQEKYLKKLLPGPYTLIFNLKAKYKKSFCFLKDTIGVRYIKNNFLNTIIKKVGLLAATSANISGEKTPVFFSDISESILNKVNFAVKNDKFVSGKASKVIDLTSSKIIIMRK